MNEIIIGQLRFILMTLLLGMGVMACYEPFHLSRWMIPHKKIVIIVEDILYWTIMAIPAYAVFFLYNNGDIRWYGMAAVFLGGIIYEKGIGKPIRKICRKIFDKPKKKLVHWYRNIKKERKRRKQKRKEILSENSDSSRKKIAKS